jgi:hypothetical protein
MSGFFISFIRVPLSDLGYFLFGLGAATLTWNPMTVLAKGILVHFRFPL